MARRYGAAGAAARDRECLAACKIKLHRIILFVFQTPIDEGQG